MSIDITNNLEFEGTVNPPLKVDGSKYAFCMYFDSAKSVVFSDKTEELISRLIPGYYRLSEKDKSEARKSYLYNTFSILQTMLLQGYELKNLDWERALEPKQELTQNEQTLNVPLLIISETPKTTNGLELNYINELSFLKSLNNTGHISLFEK